MRGASALANPYLTGGGHAGRGTAGLQGKLKLQTPIQGAERGRSAHVKLPRSLEQSLANLGADAVFGQMLGADFLKLFLTVKRHELARFRSHITDWERNEYLEVF